MSHNEESVAVNPSRLRYFVGVFTYFVVGVDVLGDPYKNGQTWNLPLLSKMILTCSNIEIYGRGAFYMRPNRNGSPRTSTPTGL